MGFASESARASVEDGSAASDALLSEYSVTPGNLNQLRTPRTPASQDTVLQVHGRTVIHIQPFCQSLYMSSVEARIHFLLIVVFFIGKTSSALLPYVYLYHRKTLWEKIRVYEKKVDDIEMFSEL